jgi:YidC/Oxa1 family membrane protein insertase
MRKPVKIALIFILSLLGFWSQGVISFAENYNVTPDWHINSLNGSTEIAVHTLLADYLFSTQGGTLRSVFLYFSPFGAPQIELIPDTETTKNASTGELERSYVRNPLFPFELSINGTATSDLMYEHHEDETIDHRLEVSFTTVINGIKFSKVFTVSQNPNYSVDFRLELENISGGSAQLTQGLQLSLGHGIAKTPATDANVRFLFGEEVKNVPLNAPGFRGVGFMGSGQVFFVKPDGDNPAFPVENHPADQGIELAVDIPALALAPGEKHAFSFLLYAGREKYSLLNHVGLGALSPPGFFSQFIIVVSQLIDWLYKLTGNYGWAIILFTLFTRILLFPLARQQFHSMARMAEVKPRLDKIQQRYPTMRRLKELHPNMSQEELFKRDRENRRALQEKMMELYREEGINPLGGCIPTLIQFPILLILWQSISYDAEAIHFSPGFLWLNDLAMKDPTYILVAITAVLMLLQSRTTPQMTQSQGGPNPMIMMLISTGMMVLLLRDFPAGMWLYYFLTTAIQVALQVFIKWEMGQIAMKKATAAAATGGPSTSVSLNDDEADASGSKNEQEKR